MATQDTNLLKPLKFSERWRLCTGYLKQHEIKHKTRDDMFLFWFLRVAWTIASALVIYAGVTHSGFKGFLHTAAFIASLWWLFYFVHGEILLNIKITRKWVAFLMASACLSKNEFELFSSNLGKSVFAFKQRPAMLFFTYAGIILVANTKNSGNLNALIIFVFTIIVLV